MNSSELLHKICSIHDFGSPLQQTRVFQLSAVTAALVICAGPAAL